MTATMGTRDVYLASADEQEARAPRGWTMAYERQDGTMHAVYFEGSQRAQDAADQADGYVARGAAVRAIVAPGRMLFDMVCHSNWKAQRDARGNDNV